MRVMITGSRNWGYRLEGGILVADPQSAEWRLVVVALGSVKWDDAREEDITLVHGECPTGADAIADMWARFRHIEIERFPADWGRYGRSAGPRRNRTMVESNPDLVLAFSKNGSRGTNGTVRMAVEHGLPVVKWESNNGSLEFQTFNETDLLTRNFIDLP